MSDSFPYACPYCQIGYCQPGKATYTQILHGQLVAVNDMPVWTCDICGYQEFEREAVLALEALLGVSETSAESVRTKVPDPVETRTARRIKP